MSNPNPENNGSSQNPQVLEFPCPKCPGITLKYPQPPLILNNDPQVSSVVIPHEKILECPFCHSTFGIVVAAIQILQWQAVPVQVGNPQVELASQMPKSKLVS